MCLSDPVPEVRANCGRVLGILALAVGESVPSMQTLSADLLGTIMGPFATSVDRSGAAQALAEILAAKGCVSTSEIILKQVIAALGSTKGYTREGCIMLLGFLPSSFELQGGLQELYETCLKECVGPSILLLADENEAVRDLRGTSCHQIISRVARIDRIALFDILLETMSDSKWRCRLGCLQLLQEYLSKFARVESDFAMGIFACPSIEELKEGGIDDRRIEMVMSKCFLYRFDKNSSAIRHLALTIWKGLAPHPLRALASILAVFLHDCCTSLVKDAEATEMVNGALGYLLCKVGDRIISQFLERLSDLFQDDFKVQVLLIATKAASSIGTDAFPTLSSEIMEHSKVKLVEIANEGLFNPDQYIRLQACKLFESVANMVNRTNSKSVVDVVIGPMLDELLEDSVVDPLTMDALAALLHMNDHVEVGQLVFERLHSAWLSLNDGEHGNALCFITSRFFEEMRAEGARRSVPILKDICHHKLDASAKDTAFKSILASLEADYDSPYQVSLSQLLEGLYSEGSVTECFYLIRMYCAVENADLSRFYSVWPARVFSSIEKYEEACQCAAALLETLSAENYVEVSEGILLGYERHYLFQPNQIKAC